MDTIASRYASALLELVIECDKVDTYQKQMKFVYSVIKENPSLVEFLKCYTIENDEKKNRTNFNGIAYLLLFRWLWRW